MSCTSNKFDESTHIKGVDEILKARVDLRIAAIGVELEGLFDFQGGIAFSATGGHSQHHVGAQGRADEVADRLQSQVLSSSAN